ncbi:MAG: hypothetical protein AB1450_09140 [Pseudomonadota bacterium]
MRRYFSWLALAGMCVLPTGAMANSDAAQQRVLQRVEQYARSYDLNRQEKYHIDFYYSPLYAMAVYRELLLWLDQADIAPGVRKEWLATVTAGMDSVIRDSHAGPAAEKGSVGIGYLRALPRYSQEPDAARRETRRWRSDEMEPQTTPAAVGKSLSAKALLLARLQPAAPEREWLLDSLRREYEVVTAQLLTLAPQGYMPEMIRRDGNAWAVVDARSRLFSQATLLRGLIETEAAVAMLGARGKDWRAKVQQHIEALFTGIVRRHFDAAAGSVVDVYDPRTGPGDRVMLEDMAQWLEALALLAQQTGPLQVRAQQLGRQQLDFLLRVSADAESPPRGYLVRKAAPLYATVRSLEDPLATLSMLQHAEQFGVQGTFALQQRVTSLLETDYWSAEAGVYRTAAGFTASAYDGHLFALVLRWLRRENDAEARQRGELLIQGVLKRGGLLQCEPPQSGEPLTLEQALAQRGAAFAAEVAALSAVEQGTRIAAFVREIADQDGDSLPGCRFAAGTYGGAPVPLMQTSVRTPYPARKEAQ